MMEVLNARRQTCQLHRLGENHLADLAAGIVMHFAQPLADAQATIAALEETILKMGENAAVVAKDAMAAKEQVAALQARVRELEARCQRAPLDHETVCHACDGSGWVERGY